MYPDFSLWKFWHYLSTDIDEKEDSYSRFLKISLIFITSLFHPIYIYILSFLSF